MGDGSAQPCHTPIAKDLMYVRRGPFVLMPLVEC